MSSIKQSSSKRKRPNNNADRAKSKSSSSSNSKSNRRTGGSRRTLRSASKIPIPSFFHSEESPTPSSPSTSLSTSQLETSDPSKNNEIHDEKSPNNQSCTLETLLRAEAAISLYCHRSKPIKQYKISLEEIYRVLRPITCDAEMVILSLLRLVGLELYSLSHCQPEGRKEAVYLEVLNRSSNRIELIKQAFIKKTGALRNSQQDKYSALIRLHNTNTINKKEKPSIGYGKNIKSILTIEPVDPHFPDDQVIEPVSEHVRSDSLAVKSKSNKQEAAIPLLQRIRERKKRQHEAESEMETTKVQSTPNHTSTDEPSKQSLISSSVNLLRIADALHSYTCLLQSRSSKLTGSSSSILTLLPSDLIPYLSTALISPNPKHLLLNLQTLSKIVPDWIRITKEQRIIIQTKTSYHTNIRTKINKKPDKNKPQSSIRTVGMPPPLPRKRTQLPSLTKRKRHELIHTTTANVSDGPRHASLPQARPPSTKILAGSKPHPNNASAAAVNTVYSNHEKP